MREFRFAVKQTIAIFFTYLFIGIAFGIMMNEAGYSAFWSLIAAMFIFAGSMQIVMVSLLKAGVPILIVAVMAFFINARHIFYGIGFIDRFRKMGWKYPYMVLTLTDETYSVLCSLKYEEGLDKEKTDFFIALINHCYWMLGCFLGGCMGQILTWNTAGIEFAATSFFLVVVVEQWQQYPSKIPVFTGILSSLIFYFLLGADNFLIPALSMSLLVLVVLRDRVLVQMGGDLNGS
jgi:4-azaleucine resistance transporter AzlC